MSNLNLTRLSITMNFLKIVSLWGASILVVFRMGVIYADVKVRITKYDVAVSEVDTLKNWKNRVEAYYMKPKPDTIYITTKRG